MINAVKMPGGLVGLAEPIKLIRYSTYQNILNFKYIINIDIMDYFIDIIKIMCIKMRLR